MKSYETKALLKGISYSITRKIKVKIFEAFYKTCLETRQIRAEIFSLLSFRHPNCILVGVVVLFKGNNTFDQ